MAMLTKLIEATGHQRSASSRYPVVGSGFPTRRWDGDCAGIVAQWLTSPSAGAFAMFACLKCGSRRDREGSDIDLLVDVDEGVGLVGIGGLSPELADLVGVPVDVVPADSLKRTRAEVLAEAVPL